MKRIASLVVLFFLISCIATLLADEQKPQTEFVFNLYRTVVKSDPDKNVAVSPYGVQQILDLTRLGAAGETRTEIEQVLGYTKSVKWETLSDGKLTTAATLWAQQGYPFLSTFLQTARTNFGSAVEQADFANDPDAAVKRINAWCSEKTKGKIPSVLNELDPMTRLVLANAIHFAADWKVPFGEPWDGNFTLRDGTEVETEFMGHYEEKMRYGETDDTLILELPYKNGSSGKRVPFSARRSARQEKRNSVANSKNSGYAMLLLLPKNPEEFTKWESAMTLEKWNTLRRTMKVEEVNMRMPLFTMESDIPLNEPLKQLGITTAFDEDNADFSKIDGRRILFVSQVLQKTYVKVDETGTEAAAVTLEAMDCAWDPDTEPKKLKEFYANRPFLYAIVKGDTILFLGRFIKPIAE